MVVTGMTRRSMGRVAVLVLAAAVSIGGGTARAADTARLHEFRGRVVSVDRGHMMFRLQSTQGIIRFRTNPQTRYAYGDWDAMHAGWRVDVHARRVDGRWVASRIERWHHAWSHDMWGNDGWHDSWMNGPMHDGWDDE